jgi:hypothetical protein
MNIHIDLSSIKINKLFVLTLAVILLASLLGVGPKQLTKPVTGMASAACLATAPPTTYGQVTQSITVATAGTYRVWSRIEAPDTTNNSYYFQVDGGCAYDIGDLATIPASAWTWVDYQDGNAASTVDVTLTAGTHVLTYTGKEPNVELDRVLLLTDTTCTPTGTGDNCAVNDTTSPTVSLTTPASGATVSGTTTVTAAATDNTGVTKVEFYVDGVLKSTDTTAAYTYAWDTTTATNATHTLQAKAYDAAGNVGSSTTLTVTVNNSTTSTDKTPPTVAITAPAAGTSVNTGAAVVINATAADNVGVTKVEFYVDGTLVSTDTTAPYSYTYTASATGTRSLTAKAYDAAGNTTTSSAVSLSVLGATGVVIPGDVNLDGHVNAIDVSLLINNDGKDYPAGEFDGTKTIDAADMAILLGHWTW